MPQDKRMGLARSPRSEPRHPAHIPLRFALFAIQATTHPALIPHEAATAGSKRPAHGGNPRLSPLRPQAPRPACHAGGRGFESRRSRSTKPLQTSTLSCLLRRDKPSLKESFAAPAHATAWRPPRRTPAKCPFRYRAEWAKTEEARKTGQTLGPRRQYSARS
jgi:hypothetical protein